MKTHTFRGKEYRVILNSRTKVDRGYCSAPYKEKRTLAVQRGLSPERHLDTMIHEALHACLWDLDEETVQETAADIAAFLWRAGYRLQEK